MIATLPDAPAIAGVPCLTEADAAQQGCALVLGYVDGKLSLWAPLDSAKPLSVDFVEGALGYRLAAGRVHHERLVKALGKIPPAATIVDATAGLGRDSALLAAAGFRVMMVEQQPALQLLLEDGLQRLQQHTSDYSLQLVKANAEDWLVRTSSAGEQRPEPNKQASVRTSSAGEQLTEPNQPTTDEPPAVVYIDVMFPERKKSAAVKKDLAWLQHLAPIPTLAEEQQLLQHARQTASHKVIVKRPAKAPYFGNQAPSSQVKGKTVRFDVYLPAT